MEQWIENPYWQWFCGFEVMQHERPIDPSLLSRWRARLGPEKLELLLEQTIAIATETGQLKKSQLQKVNVDTTV